MGPALSCRLETDAGPSSPPEPVIGGAMPRPTTDALSVRSRCPCGSGISSRCGPWIGCSPCSSRGQAPARTPATRAADQQRAMNRANRLAHFRSILCPVDFSEPSRSALRYAVAIALRGRATLRVFYVNNPLLVASAPAALHDRQFVKRSARSWTPSSTPRLGEDACRLRVTSHASIGRAAEEILKEGRRAQVRFDRDGHARHQRRRPPAGGLDDTDRSAADDGARAGRPAVAEIADALAWMEFVKLCLLHKRSSTA